MPSALAPDFVNQSVLAPHGPVAQAISALSWVLLVGAGLILLTVVGLTAYALLGPRRGRARLAQTGFVIGAGVGLPALVSTALLVYSLPAAIPMAGEDPLRILVTGEQWWWRVAYLDDAGTVEFVTANEIRIPVARSVELTLDSADVIHSFWVPSLAGKLDMIPGRVNRLRFSADRPYVFRGQCAEYCGAQHAHMALFVVAAGADEFEKWRMRQRRPAVTPGDPLLQRGAALFIRHGCGGCHTVQGTAAAGSLGPDLTHVAGRISLAAATLPNNVGTLAGWVASSQHLKPGNRMPSFTTMSGVESRAIAAWLASLH